MYISTCTLNLGCTAVGVSLQPANVRTSSAAIGFLWWATLHFSDSKYNYGWLRGWGYGLRFRQWRKGRWIEWMSWVNQCDPNFHPLIFFKFNEVLIYHDTLALIYAHNVPIILTIIKLLVAYWFHELYVHTLHFAPHANICRINANFLLCCFVFVPGWKFLGLTEWCYLLAHFHQTDTKELIFEYHLSYEVMEALKGELLFP